MTNKEFISWIHGYITLTSDHCLTAHQHNIIKNHAALTKAVTGTLTPTIETFLSQLALLFNRTNTISLDQFRQCADLIINMTSN